GTPSDNRPSRPRRPKPPAAVLPEGIGGLLSPGGPAPKPLIASADRVDETKQAKAEKYPTKSPFNKRELEKYRQTLLHKRAEVLAEVTGLEGDALTSGGSGNLSKTPQHMADAGSDAADQTISLDLAAAERNLIKEIDAALQRIRDGVFGLCEKTGKPIRTERLTELPWARYSIEAARQMEGRR
ncbi:MAG: TraR/DksA family transcriptional regulator, partial [Phycisphaerales bacterium]